MLIKHQIRKKKGKLLAIGVAMGLMSCTITGCSAIIQQEEVVLDIPEYKESDLPDGVFLKVDDTFYAPYNEGKTYGQTAMNSSPDRVIWYLEGEEKHIPTFKNGYQIVYKNKSELPDQFSLEGFEYVCDSVGIKDIRLDDKGRYTLYAATLKEGSDAETALQDLIGDTSVILDNVDGNRKDLHTGLLHWYGIQGVPGKGGHADLCIKKRQHDRTLRADEERVHDPTDAGSYDSGIL